MPGSVIDPASAVVVDLFHLTLILGVVGVVVFWVVREVAPLRRWQAHGNVFTGTLGGGDLVVAGGIVAFYYFSVTAAAAVTAPPGEAAGAMAGLGDRAVMVVAQTVLLQVFFAALLGFYLGYLRRIDLGEFFGLRRLGGKKLVMWSIGGLVVCYVVVVVAALAGHALLSRAGMDAELQVPVEMLLEAGPVPLKVLLVLAAVVGAPLMEEVVFRGFLYPVMKRHSERFFAAVFTAAVFALAHQNLGSVLPLFALGLLFAAAFELSGSLVLPMVLHGLFNGSQIALVFLAGGELDALGGAGWIFGGG